MKKCNDLIPRGEIIKELSRNVNVPEDHVEAILKKLGFDKAFEEAQLYSRNKLGIDDTKIAIRLGKQTVSV